MASVDMDEVGIDSMILSREEQSEEDGDVLLPACLLYVEQSGEQHFMIAMSLRAFSEKSKNKLHHERKQNPTAQVEYESELAGRPKAGKMDHITCNNVLPTLCTVKEGRRLK